MSLSTIYTKHEREYKQELKKSAFFMYVHVHTWDIFCFIQKTSIFASIFVISTIWKSIKKKRGEKRMGGEKQYLKQKNQLQTEVGYFITYLNFNKYKIYI